MWSRVVGYCFVVLIVPVRDGQDGVPLLAPVDAYVPVRVDEPNVPVNENLQELLQLRDTSVTIHVLIVAG